MNGETFVVADFINGVLYANGIKEVNFDEIELRIDKMLQAAFDAGHEIGYASAQNED